MSYEQFKKDYIQQHPNLIPVKRKFYSAGVLGLLLWLLVFIASAAISAVHTVPMVYKSIHPDVDPIARGAAAILAVAMVELTIFLSARYRSHGHLAKAALFLSAVAALLANLYGSAEAFALNSTSFEGQLVAAIIGIVTPLTAIVAGEMYTRLEYANYLTAQREEETYQTQMQAFDARVSKAYKLYLKQKDRPS